MSESLKEKINRVRNTFYYTIDSTDGIGNNDDIGSIQMTIPPTPFPTNQPSQLGVITFTGFHICAQTDSERLPATGYDTSGFFVIVNGLGVRGQALANSKSASLRRQNVFFVPNIYGTGSTAKSNVFNRLSGSDNLNVEMLCSNPSGDTISIEVIDVDTGNRLTENAALYSMIEFKIELLDEDISTGR
jgi:hypothetical protein